ncbi:MAG: WD40/YVTN/BNR-like repeat-containing protein [Planctomycetota bacterium]
MRPRRWIALSFAAFAAGCAAPWSPEQARWELLPCGVSASLRGLAPVSGQVCYVGGSGGTLRKTTDGGATWRDVAPADGASCDFRDVEAVGRDVVVALVAGAPARLYRSEDGGVSWRTVHEDPRPGAFFDAVAFDGDRGVVFGDAIDGRFVLLTTCDAGRTWQDVPRPALPAPKGQEAAFAASGTCLARGPAGFSLVTGGDACRHVGFAPGARPFVSALPMARGGGSRGAFSIAWRGDHGVCVGGDYRVPDATAGTAARTDDGGRTWTPVDAGGYRSGVAWLTDEDVLAVGSHGASWSTDGGRTFAPFGDEPFHSVARARDGAVWACGAGGRVARLAVRQRR